MVGPGHCTMISKYGLSLSKAVGPVDPFFLVVKKSHFNKIYSSYSKSMNSTKQKVHVGSQYKKTYLKQLVTIQNGWNNRISYGCVYAQIRSGLGMHLVTYSNHDTVLFLLIVPIKGRFV